MVPVVPDKITTIPATVPPPQAPSINDVAKVMVQSGFFKDLKSVAQAAVKIMAGQELGIPPVAAIMGIHIIKEKVSMGANLLASRIRAHGYDYRVKQLDTKACAIVFLSHKEGSKREELGTSEFTLDDAKAAGLLGGDNWRKYLKNMLFARAVSNGVKWFVPDVTGGNPIYTPDELGSLVNEDGEPINVTIPQSRASEDAPESATASSDPVKEEPAAVAAEPSKPVAHAMFREADGAGKPRWILEVMLAYNAILEMSPEEAALVPEKYLVDSKGWHSWDYVLTPAWSEPKAEKWWTKVLTKLQIRVEELAKQHPPADIKEDPIPDGPAV
jgi:hypothetical protein